MKLSSLIPLLQAEFDRRGDVEVFLDTPTTECEIKRVESFHPHGDVKLPVVVAISACEEESD